MRMLQRRITAEALIAGFIISLIPLLLKRPLICFGLWIGTLTSVVNFRLLAKKVEKMSYHTSRAAPAGFFLNYIIRYGIIGLVLWVSINKSLDHFIGAAVGLFMIRIAIYMDQFMVARWKMSAR